MKTKKQALFHSVVSLILCISMFVGTTFAWFTDSVTSGINMIAAGNLDVELYHSNAAVTEEQVDSATKLFLDLNGNPILWEPGVVSYENLHIANEGDLALSYQMAISSANENFVVDPTSGAQYGLSQILKVGVVEGGITATDRIGVVESVEDANWTTFADFVRSGSLLPKDKGESENTLGIVIYWEPGEYDNLWNLNNGKTLNEGEFLMIDLGIKLIATQTEYESDSFGDDYDASAKTEFFPVFTGTGSVSMPIVPNDQNQVAADVQMTAGQVSATIPAGVQLAAGTTELTMTVEQMGASGANITLGDNEAMRSLDVHVEGISADNTVPMEIYIKEAAAKGLNAGNLKLYHVENGQTVQMHEAGATPAHNQFKYDPATGDVTLYMATFSEVALVADTENAWEGKFDYTWYDASKTELTIANADQLAAFGAIVGGMNGQTQDSFKGKTVKLLADVNLGDKDNANESLIFHPIGYYYTEDKNEDQTAGDYYSTVNSFEGAFDGNGHTISNFYQNTWEIKGDYDGNYYDVAMGLFGYVLNGTVKNLTVSNFSSDGEYTPTGVIAAYADGNSKFENIAITNCNPRVYNTGNGGIIGIAGDTSAVNDDHITLKNITVDNSNKISALWGSWDVACGGLVGMYRGNVDGSGKATGDTISFENCHVSAIIDVYNDVCANYQYYAYRYSGMIIGSVRHNTTSEGKTIPNMTGISATGCTVHFGTWNDYYYCELVDNTTASYTHDYQMSRLVEIKAIDGATITYLDGTTGTVPASGRANYVIVDYSKGHGTENATCYHFKNGEVWTHDMGGIQTGIDENGDGQDDLREDKQHLYLKFSNLFTGYGWGVSSMGIDKWNGIKKLDVELGDQQESVVKFETKFTGDFLYRVGNADAVSLGSLFAAAAKKDVNGNELKDENGKTIYWDIQDSSVFVTVDKVDENSNVSGTFEKAGEGKTWTEGTIEFDGTGVVKVTIQDYNFCTPTELYLEVVDAKNTTTASFSGNTVLLNDVTVTTTASATGVVYGNGFTVNMENASISEKNGAVFHLYDGTILKHLNIVGKEFTTVAANANNTNYGVSAVRAWGTVTIENCYISGCRSAVYATGTELTIKDSVIANGVYANIDLAAGTLNLNNVTTINEPHSVNGTTVVGLGIVGNMTASAGRKINVSGYLKQYNWVSKEDCNNIKASGISSIFNSVFTDDEYANLRYAYNGTTYVNTGILSLSSDFTIGAVSGIPNQYGGMEVEGTISNVTVAGYVWTQNQAGSLTAEDMKYHGNSHNPNAGTNNQGSSYIPPAFDYSKADLEVENNVVQISYETGSTYTLTNETLKKLLTTLKNGETLQYTISMDGKDYTNTDIVFDSTETKQYTVTYKITDHLIYDGKGNLTGSTETIVKDLLIYATVVDKGADAPTFTFYYGTNGSASAGTPHATQPTNTYTSTIRQIGDTYYIMPNVSATSANAIGSKTIDGVTVYYPIVDGINVRSGSSNDYDFMRYYPIFKAVKINDNGTEYTYSGTKEMPATVSWVSAEIDSGNGASALNDGFGLYNNQYLCKIQKKAGDAESGGTAVVKYSYTALDGNTYSYYVGYRFYDEDEGGLCVTPDTLITLADGSQVRVDSLTGNEELLVWNHETGKLDKAPVAYIVNHDAVVANHEVYHLNFSNGKTVKIIGEHVFFDTTLNKYVALDSNSADYIGHEFLGLAGNGVEKVKLVSVAKKTYKTSAYEVVTYKHLTCFTNNMLSTSAYLDQLLNVFDINTNTFAYDMKSVARDIETYGLYTYADFEGLISEEAFDLYNAKYLKVAIGKGYITWEDILDLIDIYFNVDVQPIQ